MQALAACYEPAARNRIGFVSMKPAGALVTNIDPAQPDGHNQAIAR
ncbi:MAG TPA: hypothetical protein VHO91_02870 [Rhodopila sp.]|nr:hypothetical protein [Rhodopila sp.]